ncbi:MAG TPA: glycosyltransferase family 4 protein [Chryseolinea sp.]|nr:glycosyltransferase family 4 protein [Chryseolinea sp.]
MAELRRSLWSTVGYPIVLILNTCRYWRLARSMRIDLSVNNDFYNLILPLAAIFGLRVPYVCFVRFMPSKFPKPLVWLWCKLQLRYAARVIAVSEAVKRELPGSDKIVVVYNELPEQSVSFIPSDDSTMILYPANYIPGKGQEFALEAFCQIHKKFPQWRLRFVGGDMGLEKNRNFRASLIKRSKELECADLVEWLDFSADLRKHYLEAAFVLNFSDSESFSLTTLEALYHGRTSIATRCGGPEEIIRDHDTGILVPVGNVVAMANAMEHLMSDSNHRTNMGKSAYVDVRRRFSVENTVQRLSAIYTETIATASNVKGARSKI